MRSVSEDTFIGMSVVCGPMGGRITAPAADAGVAVSDRSLISWVNNTTRECSLCLTNRSVLSQRDESL